MRIIVFKTVFLCVLFFNCHSSLLSQETSFEHFKKYIKDISEKYPQYPDSIISIYNQILHTKEVQADLNKQAYLHLRLGNIYTYDKFESAIGHTYFQKSLELAHKAQDCTTEISSLIGLTLIFFELNKLDSLISNYEKAAQLVNQCPASNNKLYIFTQLGVNYSRTGNFEKAELNFKMGDSVLMLNKINNDHHINYFYSSIISFYKKIGNKEKVLFYLQKAKRKSLSKIQSYMSDADLTEYLFIIDIFKSINQVDSALHYAILLNQLPINKYSDYNKKLIRGSNDILADLYFEKGDLEKAFHFKDIYAVSLDSTINSQIAEKANDKVTILENELMLEKQKNQANQNKIIAISIGLLALVALIFLVFFYKNAQKLRKLNTVLESQKLELTSLNEIRVRMFSILSHDLRSPIGALTNMMDLYQNKIISKEEFDGYTTNLKQSLNAILSTLNNILDWSYAQLKGKKPYIEPLNVYKIIEDQLDLQAEMARQKEIILVNNVPTDFTVEADFNQFSLIARNLINNALKYTPNTGKLEINASYTEGGKILEFRDTGIGMNEQQVKNLFNPNEKKYLSPNGKGLGLQMVNDFLEANNCSISVTSKEHEGSVFTLLFPENEGLPKGKIRIK